MEQTYSFLERLMKLNCFHKKSCGEHAVVLILDSTLFVCLTTYSMSTIFFQYFIIIIDFWKVVYSGILPQNTFYFLSQKVLGHQRFVLISNLPVSEKHWSGKQFQVDGRKTITSYPLTWHPKR